MRLLRRVHPSPGLVVACIALTVALGGTSYAAVQRLPRNSVTTYQVKDFSLLSRDFKRGQIPAGPQGPAGPAGPAGPVGPAGPAGGTAVKWVVVRPDGGIVAQSGGITLAAKPSSGEYLLNFGSSVAGKPILSSGGYANDNGDQRGETSAGPCGGGGDGIVCSSSNNSNTVFVQTRTSAGIPGDHAFYVAVLG